MAFLLTIPQGTVVTGEVVHEFTTSSLSNVMVGINVAAVSGTSPSLRPYFEVLGTDNVWYEVWKPTALTAVGQLVTTIGPGSATGAVLGVQARLRFEVTGTTPSFTLSASVNGH